MQKRKKTDKEPEKEKRKKKAPITSRWKTLGRREHLKRGADIRFSGN